MVSRIYGGATPPSVMALFSIDRIKATFYCKTLKVKGIFDSWHSNRNGLDVTKCWWRLNVDCTWCHPPVGLDLLPNPSHLICYVGVDTRCSLREDGQRWVQSKLSVLTSLQSVPTSFLLTTPASVCLPPASTVSGPPLSPCAYRGWLLKCHIIWCFTLQIAEPPPPAHKTKLSLKLPSDPRRVWQLSSMETYTKTH